MSPFDRTFAAATGYCELGMWQDAWDELETLEPEQRAEMCVFDLRLGIFVGMKKWESAAVLAVSMAANGSTAHSTYLLGAYAIRRHESLPAAKEFLLSGRELLRGDATFYFNLACYDCQLGDILTAKESLERAFKLNSELRLLALQDEDLAPMW